MIGNIRFIGELFKADMVGSNILKHCIVHLMPNVDADEINMENLCKLFETAGKKWEEARAVPHFPPVWCCLMCAAIPLFPSLVVSQR
jgi:hypothetical protein